MRAAILAVALVACFAGRPVFSQQSAPANETPSQFYLRYRAAVAAAGSAQQIVELWSTDQRSEFSATPADERPSLAEIKAILQAVSGIRVLKESATTTTATLDVVAAMEGRPVKATVRLVLEKDGWKVASGPERWVDGGPMTSVVRRVPLQ